MNFAAALLYWVIVALWLTVLATVAISYLRDPRAFGTTRLLLIVVAIDTVRNVIENLYFGLYFGGQYGLFPGAIVGVLGNPNLLIIPKLINAAAACVVLGLLLMRWLPAATQERAEADADRQQKSDALAQESEERRRLFETSLDLILVTDRHGNFIRVSPSSTTTIGYSPDEMVGRNAMDFVYPDDLEATRREMRLARGGRAMRNFETRYVHKNGRVVPLAWSGVWSEPEQKHFFFGRDMTDLKVAEEKLRQLAHFDQLTGLPNRTTLRNDLSALITQCMDGDMRAVSIAMLDLDGFKDINDTLGHSVGDRLLQEVARRLTETVDETARVYRLGGDEFVLVFPDCGNPLLVADIIESIVKRLGERFDIDGQRLFIGASAGVAIAPAHGTDVEDLIANADLALYDAKAAGGHTHRLFVPTLRAKAQARRELDTALRRAFAENEFVLYFQPQMRVSDGAVVGAEALLRWRHPEHGILGPGAFIEALSQSPVVLEAGRWILQTACETAAAWRAVGLPPVRIGVNLFPAQFHDGTLLGDVETALQRSGLPADALELEITENIALHQDEAVLAPLRALRHKGVGLAFDDFGTGYASLSYLARYPLTRIKIDKSFVQKIGETFAPEDVAIVRSIIVMAHNLGLGVIAEGVETPTQAAFLRSEKCEEMQGFLYAEPLPAAAFEAFLRSRQARPQDGAPERLVG
jgi:diguanylate cyclase (GGDEF)-like protein/PAS domain S-box-containing protein